MEKESNEEAFAIFYGEEEQYQIPKWEQWKHNISYQLVFFFMYEFFCSLQMGLSLRIQCCNLKDFSFSWFLSMGWISEYL